MENIIPKTGLWYPGVRESHPLAAGLRGLWPLLDGGGDLAVDVCAGKNGKLYHIGPTVGGWKATDRGTALRFAPSEGGDDYVRIAGGDTTLYQGYTGITVAAWVNLDTIASDGTLLSKYWDGSNRSWHLTYDTGDEHFHFLCSTDDQNDNSEANGPMSVTSTGRWYHVVGTWDGDSSKLRIYVDGVEGTSAGQSGVTVRTNNSEVWLGASWYGGGGESHLQGLLSMPGVWDRAVNLEEARELYEDPFGLITPRKRTCVWVAASAAGAPGQNIPEKMDYYRRRRSA